MRLQVLPAKETPPVQQGDTSPAIVILSSSLVVLYANHGGTAVLRELKNAEEGHLYRFPRRCSHIWRMEF